MVCGQCGASNPEGMRFCGQCGAPLGRSCPACGAPAAESNRFCGQCGAALGSVRAAPVAERRVCSVLFVDLVGFTPLAEARDPEDVRELLSRYFERARTAVGRYGGTVEKFIGDAVMAVWGTPVAFEGDAERAVRAGLELVDLVAALGVEWGLPGLAARAGVVTGEVAVTLGASGEGMVAGDPVNTAARVQAAAPAGTVLVDEPTRRAAGPSVAFEDVGVHGLKGKADGQPLWRALRVVSWVGATRPADGLEAPLCGRDPELRGLKDLLHAGVDRRQARLVWVTGPAGVGKSRLAWELEKYVDGLAQAMLWHRGRCLSYGEGAAFGALGEMVRQRFGIADEDASDVAARKLAEGVTRFVADPAERSYVGVRLGRLLGVSAEDDGGGPLAREELFAGWRLLFERLAAVAPVVLVVDDAQHADPGLLDFLEHLVDWSRAAAILVVVLARTEGELDRARVGRNRSVVRLEPLDRAAMVALVSGLVPGLPAAAVDTVAERAHGLPLFAVETVRALLEAGVVVRGADRRYDVRGDLGSVAVPDSLHGLLAARLDGLPPGLRSLAADAAVMGGSFPVEALVGVSGRPEEEVRAGLDDLVRREVLEVSADPLSPQRGNYRFAQAMVGQVAYETLSRRDRKLRHLAVAAHLRSAFADDGEEVMDAVARHYLQALEAVPDAPDVESLRPLALDALVRAAERASRAGAPRQAAGSFSSAAELAEAGDELAVAAGYWERAADGWIHDARFDRAIDAAGRARALYERLGHHRAAARARLAGALGLRMAGGGRAREEYEAALEVLRVEPGADTVEAMIGLAREAALHGSADAESLSVEALRAAQGLEVGDTVLSWALETAAVAYTVANRPVEGAAYFREAMRLAERSGDAHRLAYILLNLSALYLIREPREAAAAATAAIDHARRFGWRHGLSGAVLNLTWTQLLTGAWDAAAQEVGERAEADGIDDLPWIQATRAALAALRGDVDAAGVLLPRFAELSTSADPQDRAYVVLIEALIADARGDDTEVLARARSTVDLSDQVGWSAEYLVLCWILAADAADRLSDTVAGEQLVAVVSAQPPGLLPPLLRAELLLARARLVAGAGAADGDLLYDAAVDDLRRVGSPWHLGRALVDLARHLRRTGRDGGAEAALAEARAIAARLGAAPLARRADAVVEAEGDGSSSGCKSVSAGASGASDGR